MTKENVTKYVLLGFLSHEPLTGYEIKKRTESSIGYFWNLGNGQIYPMLKRLTREGLVVMKRQESASGPNSKAYRITEMGRAELKKWLVTPVEPESLRSPLLLKLFFGAGAPDGVARENIQGALERWRSDLRTLEAFEENVRKYLEQSLDHRYYLLTILSGERYFRANIEWAQEALKVLDEGR